MHLVQTKSNLPRGKSWGLTIFLDIPPSSSAILMWVEEERRLLYTVYVLYLQYILLAQDETGTSCWSFAPPSHRKSWSMGGFIWDAWYGAQAVSLHLQFRSLSLFRYCSWFLCWCKVVKLCKREIREFNRCYISSYSRVTGLWRTRQARVKFDHLPYLNSTLTCPLL